jgi:hypothetical protein
VADDGKFRNHTLVRVPRAHFGKYNQMPFADVLAAAERGDDGLSLTDARRCLSARR